MIAHQDGEMKIGRTQFWEECTFGKAFFRKSNYGRPEFGGTSLSREHFWGENDLWGRVILRKNIMRSALTLGGEQLFFCVGRALDTNMIKTALLS